MKKGRAGTMLHVLCHPDKRDTCLGIVFTETSTLGVRVLPVERASLLREFHNVVVVVPCLGDDGAEEDQVCDEEDGVRWCTCAAVG